MAAINLLGEHRKWCDNSSINEAHLIDGGDATPFGKTAGLELFFKSFSRARTATPEWQFSTCKIDHDEEFRLTMMRERGTTYSSAPQSVLTSMRSTLTETGKTLLACAVAGEAGVPFFIVSASEFVELFVGRGAASTRDLLSAARKCRPSIIFIHELAAVGGKRGRRLNDERDQTLNELLTDGFELGTKFIVLAVTNRPEALDPTLFRPCRFSRKVLIGEPNEEGRRIILGVHLRGVPLEEEMGIICDLVASLTSGFVGADLAKVVNESALLAARRGGETVAREDIMEAIKRKKFGIRDKQLKPEYDYQRAREIVSMDSVHHQ